MLTAALAGCNQQQPEPEYMYVADPEVVLRDRLAAVYNKVGNVKNGERVEIVGRDANRRFVMVRTEGGVEGWIHLRHLVGGDIYTAFQDLTRQHLNTPVQGKAVTRAALNMHPTPGRDTPKLYRLAQGEAVQLMQRAVVGKPQPAWVAKADSSAAPALEDWWLVRNSQGHVGWVLGRILDVDIPLEVAQYAEGKRIVAAFVLNEIEDTVRADDGQLVSKKMPQILMLTTEPRDGQPEDFNQARVFTWNRQRDRYETAYRERNLNGFLPVSVGTEEFGKEGVLPAFTLRVKDADGNLLDRKYKMNGVMVRRVAGSEAAAAAASAAGGSPGR